MATIGNILLVGSYLLGVFTFLAAIYQWGPIRHDGDAMGHGIMAIWLVIIAVVGMGCASPAFFLDETGQGLAAAAFALGFHGLCLAIGILGSLTEHRRMRRSNSAERKVNLMLERGLAELAEHKWEQAVATFTEVIMSDPTPITRSQPLPPGVTEAYVHRGAAFAGMGQHDNAIADFTRAIKLTPDAPQPYEWRAKSRSAIGDTNGAAEDARRAGKKTSEQKRLVD
jgi:tetratricopeptide (TPR) repeat protein